MLTIAPLTAQALRTILAEPRDIEKAVDYPPEQFIRLVTVRPTVGGVLFEDGEPVVSAGVTVLKQPDCVAWLVARGELKPSYLRVILPEIRKHLAEAAARGLQIRAHVTPGLDVAERFAAKMGFAPDERPAVRIYSGTMK
jgi:hypothetical protein